jgi:hypothetical protein
MKKNSGKEVRLRKIPIEILLNALTDLYELGLEYVDLIGENDVVQDKVGIMYTEEYFRKEAIDDIVDDIIDNIIKNDTDGDNKLSDDDLNQLI